MGKQLYNDAHFQPIASKKISGNINFVLLLKYITVKNLLRAIIAGVGAKKLGGGRCGCIGTIILFIILYWLLGYVFEVF